MWFAFCCISMLFCCSAAALSSMEVILRLLPLESPATTLIVTPENLKNLNFELERERLRIPHKS